MIDPIVLHHIDGALAGAALLTTSEMREISAAAGVDDAIGDPDYDALREILIQIACARGQVEVARSGDGGSDGAAVP